MAIDPKDLPLGINVGAPPRPLTMRDLAADPPGEREQALAEDAARWRFIRDHLFVWPEPDIKGERRPWLGVKFGHGWVPSEGAPPGGASAWPEEVDRAVDAMRATRHSPAAALAALPAAAPAAAPSEDEFVIARWLWEHKPDWRTPWLATDPAFRRLQAARVREVLDAQAALRAGAAAPKEAEPPLAYARAMRDTADWLRKVSSYGPYIARGEAFQARARELDRIIEEVEGDVKMTPALAPGRSAAAAPSGTFTHMLEQFEYACRDPGRADEYYDYAARRAVVYEYVADLERAAVFQPPTSEAPPEPPCASDMLGNLSRTGEREPAAEPSEDVPYEAHTLKCQLQAEESAIQGEEPMCICGAAAGSP